MNLYNLCVWLSLKFFRGPCVNFCLLNTLWLLFLFYSFTFSSYVWKEFLCQWLFLSFWADAAQRRFAVQYPKLATRGRTNLIVSCWWLLLVDHFASSALLLKPLLLYCFFFFLRWEVAGWPSENPAVQLREHPFIFHIWYPASTPTLMLTPKPSRQRPLCFLSLACSFPLCHYTSVNVSSCG